MQTLTIDGQRWEKIVLEEHLNGKNHPWSMWDDDAQRFVYRLELFVRVDSEEWCEIDSWITVADAIFLYGMAYAPTNHNVYPVAHPMFHDN